MSYGLETSRPATHVSVQYYFCIEGFGNIVLLSWDRNFIYDRDCIYLSQRKYIRDLLAKVDMLECKMMDIPPSELKKKVQNDLRYYIEDPTLCKSAIGSIQYLVLTTLDFVFNVHKLSQYVSSHTIQQLNACKRVLRYLKSYVRLWIEINSRWRHKVSWFSDAN